MLGKIPAAGRGFKGIVSYLLRGTAGKERSGGRPSERQNATSPKRSRVLFVATSGLLTNDAEQAVRIMRATANRSRRCKAPVYHFVISWRALDRPDFATMRAIVDETCQDMGMADLQRVAIAHDDTRHRHVHVVVNRIHPLTGKAWNRRQDWVRLEVSLARIAEKYGYDRVPGRHNEPARFKDAAKKAPDREYQMARRKGAPLPLMQCPAQRVTAERPRLQALLNAATTWQELHATLAAIGYRLETKGTGLVLRDATTEMKLSLISKTARIKLLEQRFGTPFSPAKAPQAAVTFNIQPSKAVTPAHHPQLRADITAPATTSDVDYSEPPRNHPVIDTAAPQTAEDDDDEDDSPRRRRGKSR